eukprot:COSAG04_NODE_1381_length_6993_cov_41.974471_8_plen_156_part_00
MRVGVRDDRRLRILRSRGGSGSEDNGGTARKRTIGKARPWSSCSAKRLEEEGKPDVVVKEVREKAGEQGEGRTLVKMCSCDEVQPSSAVLTTPQTVLMSTPPSAAAAGCGATVASGRGTAARPTWAQTAASRSRGGWASPLAALCARSSAASGRR